MISFFKRHTPVIRERADHCISRENIDPDALKVLYRLSGAGYTAFLVGGSVRDLLLGRRPKDFDVGTDAHPNDIRHLFRNCFLIGRRFRLAHVIFNGKAIETSTFRKQPEATDSDNGLYQTEDNTFGSPEEDAKRRDFTVNGLFYDIKTFSVIDYVGGLKDLEKRTLRCIGDPNIRFREDPVRMMRAVKFAARLGFTIDRASCKAIAKHHADILNASVPRVCEEIFRLFTYGTSRAAFFLLWEFGLLRDLLPDLAAYIEGSGGKNSPLWRYLAALDADPAGPDLSNGARIACLYYPIFLERLRREEAHAPNGRVNRLYPARLALHEAAQRLRIPKAVFYAAVNVMDSPRRFAEPPQKGRSARFLFHSDFPEALAFQRILVNAENRDPALLGEWQALYDQEAASRAAQRTVERMRYNGGGGGIPPGEDGGGGPRDDAGGEFDRPPRHRSRRRRPSRPGGRPPVTVSEIPAP
ncbi:MAG: polynucleotide adenylyltransferase PcnB [Verrucomicrobiota bacterium]|jgi:poly(A) polymerase|nr:polynucleotide adenylyltransferase PcnB [Verrucomicrobiota bacterium]